VKVVNKLSGFAKDRECLEQLSNYQLLKANCVLQSKSVNVQSVSKVALQL
jgi:hypothetical protein